MPKQQQEQVGVSGYAQQHTIMLLIVLVFFAVLVVPRLYKQTRRHTQISGVVKTIYFSKDAPATSFVEITYTVKGKEYTSRELVEQRIQVGDHVEIYVGEDTPRSIQFEPPSYTQAVLLLAAYAVVLAFCAYTLYAAFAVKKK